MSFGSCCVEKGENFFIKTPKSIKIEGVQQNLIINLEITQTFKNKNNSKEESISYIFPNDSKLCIYDTVFVIGDNIIRPKLTTKKEADKIYEEAFENHKFTICGSNIAGGLTEFKIGKLPPKTELKIILKIVSTCHLVSQNLFSFKFPLDVRTPSGSIESIYTYSKFSFKIQCDLSKIESVDSNFLFGKFNKETKVYSISNTFCGKESIVLNFKTYENIQSSILYAKNINNFEYSAVLISLDIGAFNSIENADQTNKEYIFVVDCSGSMHQSIKNASECLEIFIRSLPQNSFFNIVFFGSTFHTLFDSSVKYDQTTSQKAIDEVRKLDANLNGTDLYSPLKYIYESEVKYGQRQIFILTDGEVNCNELIFHMVSKNAENNRCFTVGLGSFCDAGLVEGIATLSGGNCSFVYDNDSISEKVIPQLEASFHKSMKNIEIHVEGDQNNSFLVSPFPIPSIMMNNSIVVYLRNENENSLSNNILVSGQINNETIEFQIDQITQLHEEKEDEFGFSKGANLVPAIRALFAFNYLIKYDNMIECFMSPEDKENATQISLEGGILSKFTGFIGCIDSNEIADKKLYDTYSKNGYCFHSRPTFCQVKRVNDNFLEDFDEMEEEEECDDEYEIENSPHLASEMKSNSFDLMKMMSCQKFDGFWDDLDEVNKIAQTNINDIKNVQFESDECLKNKCICTFVAVAAIHVLSPEKKNSWNIICKKAEDWLKNVLPNINIDEILLETEKIIKI